jgi:hypothetical protein
MAELSRHIIHMSETLQVAVNILGTVLEASKPGENSQWSSGPAERINESLRFSTEFLRNLQQRSDAFADRLQNEMTLVRATPMYRMPRT